MDYQDFCDIQSGAAGDPLIETGTTAMELRHVLYVSSATRRLQSAELEQILAVSRRNNQPVGVTGLLIYEDGNFMQALEGPAENVSATLARIHADERHRDIRMIVDFLHTERAFAHWNMGFEYREKPLEMAADQAFTHAETIARLRQPSIMTT